MLEKKLLEKILVAALSNGGDFAQIFEEKKTRNVVNMLNDKVEGMNHGVVRGLGLRIFLNHQSYYAYTNDLSEDGLLSFAYTLSKGINSEVLVKEVNLKEVVYENMHPVKIHPKDVSNQSKINLVKEAIDASLNYDEHIKKAQGNYFDEVQEVVIADSSGLYVQDTRIRTRLTISAIAEDGELVETGTCNPGGSEGFEFYETNTPKAIGEEASRIAMVMLYADECPAKKMEAIIDNGFGGVIFHEACGHSLEASMVSKGQSIFCGKLNTQIASSCVTAIDDGTIPYAWGCSNVDDEGHFTRKNVLIENGILKSYMIDPLSARRMDMEHTSNSRRESYKFETTSRMTNTFIAPGNDTFEEMLAKTKEGIYAKSLGGGSVNPISGNFNFAVREGYYIKDGKIIKPVKGATLIGNGAEILMNIDMVGNNLLRAQGMCGASSGSIPADVGQPTIHVSSILVGGKANE